MIRHLPCESWEPSGTESRRFQQFDSLKRHRFLARVRALSVLTMSANDSALVAATIAHFDTLHTRVDATRYFTGAHCTTGVSAILTRSSRGARYHSSRCDLVVARGRSARVARTQGRRADHVPRPSPRRRSCAGIRRHECVRELNMENGMI